MRSKSQQGNDLDQRLGGLILTTVTLIVVLFLITVDPTAALFQLVKTSHGFPPETWSITPPEWVD
jgi:hypothetical protein